MESGQASSGCSFSADSSFDQGLVIVEQGPCWLAQLFYDPPVWVAPAIIGFACLVAAAGLYGYRRYGLSEETKVGMLFNTTVVFGVAGGVTVLKSYGGLSYLGDALGGLAIGLALAYGLRRWCYSPLVADPESQRK